MIQADFENMNRETETAYDRMVGEIYAFYECLEHGYSPDPAVEDHIRELEDRIADWVSDVEYSF